MGEAVNRRRSLGCGHPVLQQCNHRNFGAPVQLAMLGLTTVARQRRETWWKRRGRVSAVGASVQAKTLPTVFVAMTGRMALMKGVLASSLRTSDGSQAAPGSKDRGCSRARRQFLPLYGVLLVRCYRAGR
jgi:hypothetical protein